MRPQESSRCLETIDLKEVKSEELTWWASVNLSITEELLSGSQSGPVQIPAPGSDSLKLLVPLESSSRLSLLLNRDVSTSCSIGGAGPRSSSRSGPGSSACSRGRGRRRPCPRRAGTQNSGDLTLHEGPGGAVGGVVQRTALPAGTVDFPVASPALDVDSGAGEAEPVSRHRRALDEVRVLQPLVAQRAGQRVSGGEGVAG